MYLIWTDNEADEVILPKVPLLRQTVAYEIVYRSQNRRRATFRVETSTLFGALRAFYHKVDAKNNGWTILGYRRIEHEEHMAFTDLETGWFTPAESGRHSYYTPAS